MEILRLLKRGSRKAPNALVAAAILSFTSVRSLASAAAYEPRYWNLLTIGICLEFPQTIGDMSTVFAVSGSCILGGGGTNKTSLFDGLVTEPVWTSIPNLAKCEIISLTPSSVSALHVKAAAVSSAYAESRKINKT